MQTKEKITLWNGGKFGDYPTCRCGNTPAYDGFYPTLFDGLQVEPDDERWTNGLYICGRCELIGVVLTDEEFKRNGSISRTDEVYNR